MSITRLILFVSVSAFCFPIILFIATPPQWPQKLSGRHSPEAYSAAACSKPILRGKDEQTLFRGLGDLPGGIYRSTATDVSGDGLMVVGHSSSAKSGREAFQWTLSGGLTPLGFLHANGVSVDGEMVVGCRLSDSGSAAVGWTTCGEAFSLGQIPGCHSLEAHAVSADGSVIVGSASSLRSHEEAFCWVRGGNEQEETVHQLGHLPGGQNSTAFGVSADGSVVVGRSETGKGVEAFRWTLAGGMVGLGMLPGGTASEARAASADGSVVVGGGRDGAFLWTERDGIMELGSLSNGSCFGLALDVSAGGSIVVGTSHQHTGLRAFIWDDVHGMRSVRDVLEQEGGLTERLSGWRLTMATAVSADGRVVVGLGTNPQGNTEAWIARLEESPGGPAGRDSITREMPSEAIRISRKSKPGR